MLFRSIICYHCKQPGHKSPDCPNHSYKCSHSSAKNRRGPLYSLDHTLLQQQSPPSPYLSPCPSTCSSSDSCLVFPLLQINNTLTLEVSLGSQIIHSLLECYCSMIYYCRNTGFIKCHYNLIVILCYNQWVVGVT